MRILSLFLSLNLLSLISVNAQLLVSDSGGGVGMYNLDNCYYEFAGGYSLPPRFLVDIALTPDGRLLSCNSDQNYIYIYEINLTDFSSVDTLAVIETGWGATSLVCSSDYILYVGGHRIYSLNLNSNEIINHGFLPNFQLLAGDLAFFNGDLYGSTIVPFGSTNQLPPRFIKVRLDTTNTQHSEIITETFPAFTGLSKVYDGSLNQFKLVGHNFSDTTLLYEINLQDTSVLELCYSFITHPPSSSKNKATGLTNTDEFRTNFNLQLDLDTDNSSGRLLDHFITDSLCTRVYRVSDTDVSLLSAAGGIDSMVVEINEGALEIGGAILTVPEQSLFLITGAHSARLVVRPLNTVTNEDYANLVRSIRFEITADSLITGESRVDFRLYSDGQISDPAMAFIRIQADHSPSAGTDYTMDLCWPSNRDLRDRLGEGVYQEGYWIPALHDGGNIWSAFKDAPGTYTYIAQEGDCIADTAIVNVNIRPLPPVNYNGVFESEKLTYICPGDTAIWAIDTALLQEWEWLDGFEDPIRPITSAGHYNLFIVDNYGCDFLLTTSFEEADWHEPYSTIDTVSRCEGESLPFYGQLATSDTLLCKSFPSTGNCDYTFCRRFEFDPPLEHYINKAICEGEIYWLDGIPLTNAGEYESYREGGECDTILYLDLFVHPTYEINLIVGMSPGGSYTIGDSVLTQAGFYDILLETTQGCDSLIHVEIEITSGVESPFIQPDCTVEHLLYKGLKDWQFSTACNCKIDTWRLFDSQGRHILTKKQSFGNSLLSIHEQNSLAEGLYFYQLSYFCQGHPFKGVGKLILVD